MQNIQSILQNALNKKKHFLKGLCCKKTAWIGLAVISITIAADTCLYGNVVEEKDINECSMIAADLYPVEAETQTEDIVEDEIAEIESDEVHLVMGTMNQSKVSEEYTEQTEEYTEESTKSDAEVETVEVDVPQYVISFTEEDYNNFLRVVEAEATGADVLSKIMVADVIINRVKSPLFPNTLTEVIFQGNGEQFSPVYDGRFYNVTVTESTIEAVNRALAGEDYSQGATYFAAVYVVTPDCWHSRNLQRLFEYGGHIFFKEY